MRFLRFFLWIIKAILLLVLVFLGLITLDYYFAFTWMTDELAFGILALAFFSYILFSVIKYKQSPNKIHSFSKKPLIACLIAAVLFCSGFALYNLSNRNELDGVPEDVIEFGKKYPEAEEYVRNFNKYVGEDFDMDVSSEMAKNDIPLFIQWDKRWGYKDYGSNYVGVAGCGPTCIAMVACGLEHDSTINPYIVSSYAAEQGYYTYGQGTSWAIMTDGASHYGLHATEGNVSADYILQNLSSQTPMICSMSPGDFTTSGHFIVLTGIDSNGKIIVNDPNSPKNSKQHWDVDTLVSQMKSVWKYNI